MPNALVKCSGALPNAVRSPHTALDFLWPCQVAFSCLAIRPSLYWTDACIQIKSTIPGRNSPLLQEMCVQSAWQYAHMTWHFHDKHSISCGLLKLYISLQLWYASIAAVCSNMSPAMHCSGSQSLEHMYLPKPDRLGYALPKVWAPLKATISWSFRPMR